MSSHSASRQGSASDSVQSSSIVRLAVGALLLVGLGLILDGALGITPQVAQAGPRDDSVIAPQRDSSHWPHDPATGRLRELGEHPAELELNPTLFYLNELPSGMTPAGDITPLGIQQVLPDEAGQLAFTAGWKLLDARKPMDQLTKGAIPGAACHPYSFKGAVVKFPRIALTSDIAHGLLEDSPGLVVYCNGPGCRRSYNACIAIVQDWGVDPNRIRWLRSGVVGWKRTLLVSMDLTQAAEKRDSP